MRSCAIARGSFKLRSMVFIFARDGNSVHERLIIDKRDASIDCPDRRRLRWPDFAASPKIGAFNYEDRFDTSGERFAGVRGGSRGDVAAGREWESAEP